MSCLLQDCQSLDLTMLPRGSQRDLTHGTVWMAGEGGINPVLMQDPQGVSSPNTQDRSPYGSKLERESRQL